MSWLMAFLMSSPGIPCIYYGDEIADVGGNDPDNRRMMRFDGWNEQNVDARVDPNVVALRITHEHALRTDVLHGTGTGFARHSPQLLERKYMGAHQHDGTAL